MSDTETRDFRIMSDDGDVIFLSITAMADTGDGLPDEVEDAIRERLDRPDIVIERR